MLGMMAFQSPYTIADEAKNMGMAISNRVPGFFFLFGVINFFSCSCVKSSTAPSLLTRFAVL